jgi:hypothetical protein
MVFILWLVGPKAVADVNASHEVPLKWKDRVEWVWPRVTFVVKDSPGVEPKYEMGYVGARSFFSSQSITHDGLAKGMLDQLESDEWLWKEPAIYQ